MSEPLSPQDHLKAQAAEYGTYRARGPIFIDGVLAFTAGHPVPVGHVESGLVDPDSVEKVDSGEQKSAPVKPAATGNTTVPTIPTV